MKFKHTAILLAIGLALVGGLIVYSLSQPDDPVATGETLFPGLAGLTVADIDTLELVRTQPKEEKIVFTRVDPGKIWKVTSPNPANVEQRDVDSLVEAVLKLKPVPFAELKNDPKAHGLDAPTVKLTLRQGSAKTAILNVGTTTIGAEKAVTFVTTSADTSRPLAVRKSDLAPLFKDPATAAGEAGSHAKTLTDFRIRRLLGTGLRDPLTDATAVRIKTGPKELSLKADAGNWQFAVPETFGDADSGGDVEPNRDVFTGVKPLLQSLTLLQASSVADILENPTAEDLAKYGLKADDAAAMRIELTSKAGTETVYIGKTVDGETPPKRYLRLDGDSCVVKVPVDRYDALLRTVADPTELRNRDLFPGSQLDRIDAMDVTVGPNTISLRKFGTKEQGKWYVLGPEGPKEANFSAVDPIRLALGRPRAAVGFPVKPDPAVYAGPELKAVLTVWKDAVAGAALPEAGKPVPEIKGDPIVFTIGKKEGETVFVKRTEKGRSSEYKLPDAFEATVAKSRLEFLAAGVPSFPTNKVASLTLDRPAGSLKVVKATGPVDVLYPNGKWTFAAPADRKDQIADQPNTDALLGVLAHLRAQKVVAEKPSDAELLVFGLTTPRVKASLELSDEPGKIRTFEFGSETVDKGFVYARHGGSTHVYTVPKVDLDRLIGEDLRDAILYRIDRSKLNAFTLRGWSGTIPVPPPHEYVRTGTDWKCTAPAEVVADPQKVAAFLGHAEQPRAVRFLGPVKPEYKLEVAAGAIEITLKQEGQAPVVLLLGMETDGGLNYIASVSTKPSEAVVVQAAALRAFAGTPGGLSISKQVVPPAMVPEKK